MICDQTPATVEPRFGYTVCEAHEALPPVEVSRIMAEKAGLERGGRGD